MGPIFRQCVGIDMAKDDLAVCMGISDADFNSQYLSNEVFKNDVKGFEKLLKWSKNFAQEGIDLFFVVEATGVYHEKLTHFLFVNNALVSVLLPNKAKAFAKTLKVKTVNDKTSAQMLSQFGLEKKLQLWESPSPVYNALRQLTRERDQIILEQKIIKNQMHAELHEKFCNRGTIKRMEQRIKLISKQIKSVDTEVKDAVNAVPELKEKVKKITTIPGVGFLTAVTIIGETNGFNLIRNKNQLVSYAGLDVVEKQSGTSVRGKKRISKKGNSYLRKSLYMPSLSSIRCCESLSTFYNRLVDKHQVKMKALVAVQRKVLVLVYTLWKNDTEFDPEYLHKKGQPLTVALGN